MKYTRVASMPHSSKVLLALCSFLQSHTVTYTSTSFAMSMTRALGSLRGHAINTPTTGSHSAATRIPSPRASGVGTAGCTANTEVADPAMMQATTTERKELLTLALLG